MQTFELILFLLAAVIASSILDKFLPRVSLPLVQVALGAVIAAAVATPLEWGIDPELLLILFIAPLHFNETRHVDSGQLWKNRWGIASLSVGLVVAIVIACGATLHALVPAIPLAAACALGAAMGSTDAVAVTALTHDRRFGGRHEALLKGEALFNDVTGTVIFQCCVTLLATGAFSLVHAGEEFALDLFGGFAGGLVMGVLAWGLLELIRRTGLDTPTLHVMLELLLPFVIYLAAKSLHIGAVIAVVAAGLIMSLLPQRHTVATARTKLQAASVWQTLEFVLNGIIFVILGMQLPRLLAPAAEGSLGDPAALLGVVVVLTLVLEAVRFAWILAMDALAAAKSGRGAASCLTPRALCGTLAMAFAGAKGGITLSLMLTLTAAGALSADDRSMLVSVASGMIVLTLVLADFAVPALVPSKRSAARSRDRVDAEIGLVLKVIASVQADAPFTGAVRAGGEARAAAAIDEPATVIVMHRYAEILEDLVSGASPATAEAARAEIARVRELYDHMDAIGRAAAQWDGETEEDETGENPAEPESSDADSAGGLTGYFQALRATYEAVEDVQSQALARELQLIKQMREAGTIDAAHAKELRNDVYIQQLTLD
ncbi:sodium:proton antiporter [uncultured Adlercreutzia sp.]|uniref:cation:proton antiporter n=1 Tax=uncultured Adlercreutzia sp. TaxID=875803 RepID=UPI0026754C84|nr:sodium:proton antiporter [uncultured Adlercreutzia sp.]